MRETIVFTTDAKFGPIYTVAVRDQNGVARSVVTETEDGRAGRALTLRPADAFQIASGIDVAIARIDRATGKVRSA
ncbi:MAG TPA: hypothetical protein VGI10_12565 [Polyangiaceae bacterium]